MSDAKPAHHHQERQEPWSVRLPGFLMPRSSRSLSPVWRYALAVAIVATTTLLRVAMIPWMGASAPYNIAPVAVVLSTILLGLGPGLLSVLLGYGAADWFVARAVPAESGEGPLLQLATSLAAGVLMAYLLHAVRVASERLRESQARLAAFAAHTSEGLVESEAGRIVDCNAQFAEIAGRTIEELRGMDLADLVAPEDRDLLAAVDAGNGASVLELATTRRDGKPIVVEARGQAADPASRRRYTVVHDLTKRRLAERQFLETNQRLQALMNALPVGVSFSSDATCQEITGNPTVLKQFGATTEDNLSPSAAGGEALGRQIRYFHDGRQLSDAELPLQRAVAENREIPPVELEVVLPGGRRWYAHASGAPIRDVQGEVAGGVAVTVDITESVGMKEALRQSRRDQDRAQAVGQIGSWRMDVQRNVLTWSPENHRIFGVPQGTPMTYETFLGIVHPDDREFVDTKWKAGLRGEPYDIEHRLLVGDQVKWVREKAYLEFDATGELLGGFGITQDITERKRAEESLRESEARRQTAEAIAVERQRLFDVLETLPEMVCLLSPDHHVTFANRSFRDKFGESGGRRCYEYCFGRTAPCESCQTYEALKTTLRHHWETTTPDGSVLDVHAFPFTDADGSPLILEVETDITERRRSEAELAAHREHLEELVGQRTALLETSNRDLARHSDALQGINAVLRSALASGTDQELGVACLRVAETITGSRFGFIGEVAGGGIQAIALSDPGWDACSMIEGRADLRSLPQFEVQGIYGRVVSEGKSVLANDPAHHPDRVGLPPGHAALESFLGVPLLREGRPIGLIAVGNRPAGYGPEEQQALEALAPAVVQAFLHKRAERALQQAKEALEHRVAERTAALAERAAQLRALAGELTLSEWRERRRLAKLLHDHLQQWLFAAKIRVALIDGQVDDAIRPAVAEVDTLLTTALNASRSLTTELNPPVAHGEGVAAGLQWLARWASDTHHLKVDLDVGEGLPELIEDVTVLLFESVRELLFNVSKHADVGAARVQVSRVDGELHLVVSDQGTGFDTERIQSPGAGGGGFGLFSIRERVGLMGGTTHVDSAPGKGSRITIALPLARVTATAPVRDVQPPVRLRARALPAVDGARIRVLLVDDHAVVRHGLERLLGDEEDMEVVGQASDGFSAIDQARLLLPDVILMDLSMPELGGIDATEILGSVMPSVRVIGLTMHEDAGRVQRMLAAGATACLSKRDPAEMILAAIRACRAARA